MSAMAYDFEWDAQKAETNLMKHGVTFQQAAAVFSDPLALTVFDEAHSDFEERWFTLGQVNGQILLAVSHTYVATSPTHIRVRLISARPATKQERRFYANEPH